MLRKINQTLATATILSGQSVSNELDLGGSIPLHILIPAAWTAAAITIETSLDGINWVPFIYDDANALVQISSPVAGNLYTLSFWGVYGLKKFRLRSGTSSSPINQSADRSITIVSCDIQ